VRKGPTSDPLVWKEGGVERGHAAKDEVRQASGGRRKSELDALTGAGKTRERMTTLKSPSRGKDVATAASRRQPKKALGIKKKEGGEEFGKKWTFQARLVAQKVI